MKRKIFILIVTLLLISFPTNSKCAEFEGNYLKIAEIYPFTDLINLKEVADKLSERNVPFVCEVMPVFYNTDFPAFDRLCDTIRYAEYKGGSIVMHKLVNVDSELETIPYEDKLKESLNAFAIHNVSFMAYDVNDDYLNYSLVYNINYSQDTVDEFIGTVENALKNGEKFSNLRSYIKKDVPAEFISSNDNYSWDRGYKIKNIFNIKDLSDSPGSIINLLFILIPIFILLNSMKNRFKKDRKQ